MNTEAEAVEDIVVRSANRPQVIKTEDGREYLLLPESVESTEVTPKNKIKTFLPDHVIQHVTLQTTDSLIDYINRHRDEKRTVVFADIAKNTIVGIIDYHEPDERGGKPSTVAHRPTLTLTHSTEWVEWSKISGSLMEQLAFARFIEENGADVRAPTGAELLECVRDLQAHRKVNFTKAVRTSSDNENFEYSDETTATSKKGGIEVPAKFKLGIPVYFGETDVELFAFLRWRLTEGNLFLGIQTHRAEHVRQAVFKQIVAKVAERTSCLAMFGTP